jgi:hypothetical protein
VTLFVKNKIIPIYFHHALDICKEQPLQNPKYASSFKSSSRTLWSSPCTRTSRSDPATNITAGRSSMRDHDMGGDNGSEPGGALNNAPDKVRNFATLMLRGNWNGAVSLGEGNKDFMVT